MSRNAFSWITIDTPANRLPARTLSVGQPSNVGEPHGRLELRSPAIARGRIVRISRVAGSLVAGRDADQRDAQPFRLDGPRNVLDRLGGPGEFDGIEPGRPDGQESLEVGQLREEEADVYGKAHRTSSG